MNNKVNAYLPLICLIGVNLLLVAALQVAIQQFNLDLAMNHFMGFFFSFLGLFKIFNLNGFKEGFQKYDLIAKKYPRYAYLYPFIELALGFFYIAGIYPLTTNVFTFGLMSISGLGVWISIRNGLKTNCACLGTVLQVPLSTVSVIENLGMAVMAVVNIYHIMTIV